MPFQLSGGMCQRVALAAALARDPELLIADEPSTALDVTTQAEIMKLLKRVQVERGMSMILITHDLRLAFSTCDRVYVLYAGSLLEVGDAKSVESDPHHPYTLGPAAFRAAGGKARAAPDRDTRLGAASRRRRRTAAPSPTAATGRRTTCRAAKPAALEIAPGRVSACVRRRDIDGADARVAEARPRTRPEPRRRHAARSAPLIRVRDLVKTFVLRRGQPVHALKGVSIEIAPGESVGLVGESGSGKTTLGRCLVGLETPTERHDRDRRHCRRPTTARSRATSARSCAARCRWSFRIPIRRSIRAIRCAAAWPRRCAPPAAPERDAETRIRALLRDVGLPEDFADRRPASLSGGERQRVAIARSLAVGPKILVCDEPVSALDVSVQAQILNLFKRLQDELGLSYLFITHDLAVVRQIVDRIYVLYRGEIVEDGPTEAVMSHPKHPYTRRLIDSIPG